MTKLTRVATLVMVFSSALAFSEASAKSLSSEIKLATTHNSKETPLPEGWKILQFWASWCVNCDKTMNSLASLATHKDVSSFNFIPVSVDNQCHEVDSYFKAKPNVQRFESLVRRDPGGILAQSLQLRGIPTVLLVNPEGEVVKEFVGHPSKAQLDSMRQALQTSDIAKSKSVSH